MGALAAFALGVLVGLVIYWLVYRVYWLRWRGHMERDNAYLRAKVESAQFTSFGLERHVTTQKADLAEQRSKISDLERDKRLALAHLDEVNADKQAMTLHLDALRAELAAYKKVMMEPELPAQPVHSNGKTQAPSRKAAPAERLNTAELEMNKEAPKKTPAKTPASMPANQPPKASSNGNGSGNGNGHIRLHNNLPPEQILEPVLVIARPTIAGDRLEIIQGIGPAIVKKLHSAGIDSFLALSLLTPERLKEVVGARTAKLMDAERVISQAKKLVGQSRPRNGSGG